MTKTNLQKNTYIPDSAPAVIELTASDLSRVLYVLLAVALLFLADKVETNLIEKILSILHDKEFNSKTFWRRFPNMGVWVAA